MKTNLQLYDVALDADGTALLTFLDPGDVRADGALAVRRTLRVAPTDQYVEGIQRLVDAALDLLTDALDDWATSPPAELVEAGQERPLTDDGSDVDEQPGEPDQLSTSESRQWDAIQQSQQAQHEG